MHFSSYLILFILCLSSEIITGCPEGCECDARQISNGTLLLVHCRHQELQHVPRDHIGRDIVGLEVKARIPVLSDVDKNMTNLTQIKYLSLFENEIEVIEINSLRGFPYLQDLHLSYNKISNIPNEVFNTIPQLKTLDLSDNPYLILPENGYGTKELKDLDISYCNLKDIPHNFFDTMPSIKYLNLEGNHISHVGLNLLKGFQKMKRVNLAGNKLSAVQTGIIELIETYNVSIRLYGNPLRCDCTFRDLYLEELMAYQDTLDDDDDNEVGCVIPEQEYNTYVIDYKLKFLKSLVCNNSMIEDNTSNINQNMTDNKTSHNNTSRSTECKILTWIMLAMLVLIIML